MPNQVVRDGYWRKRYVRSDGTVVKRTWVSAVKSPRGSKSPRSPRRRLDGSKPRSPRAVIPPLNKGLLAGSGYYNVMSLTVLQRHRALAKALEKHRVKEVYGHINALSTFNKNKDPALAKIFKDDSCWVRKNYGRSFKSPYSASTCSKRK
jgi:hypothetical protein